MILIRVNFMFKCFSICLNNIILYYVMLLLKGDIYYYKLLLIKVCFFWIYFKILMNCKYVRIIYYYLFYLCFLILMCMYM